MRSIALIIHVAIFTCVVPDLSLVVKIFGILQFPCHGQGSEGVDDWPAGQLQWTHHVDCWNLLELHDKITVEPQNNGHIEEDHFVHYREVVALLEVGWCSVCVLYTEVFFIQSVLYQSSTVCHALHYCKNGKHLI